MNVLRSQTARGDVIAAPPGSPDLTALWGDLLQLLPVEKAARCSLLLARAVDSFLALIPQGTCQLKSLRRPVHAVATKRIYDVWKRPSHRTKY